MEGILYLLEGVKKRKSSEVTGVAMEDCVSSNCVFQSVEGRSSSSALGSNTFPDRMCAPISLLSVVFDAAFV